MSDILPFPHFSFEEISGWCKRYQFGEIVPRTQEVRFAIGVYQLSQGLKWKCAGPVAWQSYCSAALNFIMCGHEHGIDLSPRFPEQLKEIPDIFVDFRHFMEALGDAQQQVVYRLHLNVMTTRTSRYSVPLLEARLDKLVRLCFSLVQPDYREQGCIDEMAILTKDLIKGIPQKG
jgi:hypothetical protein